MALTRCLGVNRVGFIKWKGKVCVVRPTVRSVPGGILRIHNWHEQAVLPELAHPANGSDGHTYPLRAAHTARKYLRLLRSFRFGLLLV